MGAPFFTPLGPEKPAEKRGFFAPYLVKYIGKIYFYIGDQNELRKMHP